MSPLSEETWGGEKGPQAAPLEAAWVALAARHCSPCGLPGTAVHPLHMLSLLRGT